MRLASYQYQGEEHVGIVRDGAVCSVRSLGLPWRDLLTLIRHMTPEEVESLPCGAAADWIPLEQVTLRAPIPRPDQDVICLGLNYSEHIDESSRFEQREIPVQSTYFSKRVNEAVADGAPIDSHADFVTALDYETELAFVLAKDAYRVPASEAERYVFGYTILNDVSARDVQMSHGQWYFGKSLDGFTPMGPWLVTRSELAFPPGGRIETRVNGELRQSADLRQMIFKIPFIIEELSRGMTLRAGTIISTGTPSGVGLGSVPPKYLTAGDVVECSIDGIGTLRNPVN